MDLSLEKDLHIRETIPEARNVVSNPRVKPAPTLSEKTIPTPFSYLPSGDGTDENLLILMHGLGEFLFLFSSSIIVLPKTHEEMLNIWCIGVVLCPRRHTCTVCEDGE